MNETLQKYACIVLFLRNENICLMSQKTPFAPFQKSDNPELPFSEVSLKHFIVLMFSQSFQKTHKFNFALPRIEIVIVFSIRPTSFSATQVRTLEDGMFTSEILVARPIDIGNSVPGRMLSSSIQ